MNLELELQDQRALMPESPLVTTRRTCQYLVILISATTIYGGVGVAGRLHSYYGIQLIPFAPGCLGHLKQ